MIEFLRRTPFIRLLIPFIAGIIFRMVFTVPTFTVAFVFILTFVTLFGFVLLNKINRNIRFQWIFGSLANVNLLAAGVLVASVSAKANSPTFVPQNKSIQVVCIIDQPPEIKEKTIKCEVKITGISAYKMFIPVGKGGILYIQKDSLSKALIPGDLIICRANLGLIRGNGNPYEFDYAKYMARRGIFFTSYINNHSWKLVGTGFIPVWRRMAYACQRKILSLYREIGLKDRDYSVISALTVGYRNELDADTKQAYSAAGVMHILAVSGMHVGLVYLVFGFIFGFLDKIKYGKVFKAIILILLIWFYAILTGLSPSVIRASVMLTLVCIGQAAKQKISIYNSIAASAFLILAWLPFQLTEVGFQLSYMAVSGIVILYSPIYRLIAFTNWFIDKIWVLISVSIAAQIGTFPLALFYFHQFPNYFIPANLIAIPFAAFIIYGSMLLLVVSWWKLGFIIVGKIVVALMTTLNSTIFFIESLPLAVTREIYIFSFDVILLYFIIIFIVSYLKYKKPAYLFFLLSVLVLGFGTSALRKYQSATKQQIVFYNHPLNSLVEVKSGLKSVWFTDSLDQRTAAFIAGANNYQYCRDSKIFLLGSLEKAGCKKIETPNSVCIIRNKTIYFSNRRIEIISNYKKRNIQTIDGYKVTELVRGKSGYPKTIHILKCIEIGSGEIRNKRFKINSNEYFTTFNLEENGAFVISDL